MAAPVTAAGVLLAEAALFAALSSEMDQHWLIPLRQMRVRLAHPLAVSSDEVPLSATIEQLQLSGAYRRLGALITSDVRDVWDDGEWRLVSYALRHEGRPATAVFAAPLPEHAPELVRVAIVDDDLGRSPASA